MPFNSTFSIQNSTLLSEHFPPRPRLYRLRRAMIGAGLALIGLALLGQALLLLGGAPLPLLPLIMLFTAILSLPLWIGTCLNPPVSTTAEGLVVRPMFGRPVDVPWTAIAALRPHLLLPADEGLEKMLYGRRAAGPREGVWVIVRGVLPPRFRLVAWIAGLGNVALFGLSAGTHTGYEALIQTLERETGLAIVPASR